MGLNTILKVMNRQISTKMRMYTAVAEVCRLYEDQWAGIPGYVSTITEFEAVLKRLNEKAVIHDNFLKNVTIDKEMKMEDLFERLMIIHSTISVFAQSINDPVLMSRHRVPISELKRKSLFNLDLHLSNVYQDLFAYGSALAQFGIDEDYVLESLSFIETGRNCITRPRMAIIERKNITKTIKDLNVELDSILKYKLDKLMRVFKKSVPVFYDHYFNARIVVVHRGPTKNSASDD